MINRFPNHRNTTACLLWNRFTSDTLYYTYIHYNIITDDWVYILINFHKCNCSVVVYMGECMYLCECTHMLVLCQPWKHIYQISDSGSIINWRPQLLHSQECSICSRSKHPMGCSHQIRDTKVTLVKDFLWVLLNFFRTVLKSKTHPPNLFFLPSLLCKAQTWKTDSWS